MDFYPQWKMKFDNLRIQHKITLIYLPLIVMPLVIVGVLVHYILDRNLITRTTDTALNNSQLIVKSFDEMLVSTESASNLAMLGINRLYKQLESQPDAYSPLEWETMIENELSFTLIVFPLIDSISFIDQSGQVYSTNDRIKTGPWPQLLASPEVAKLQRAERTWMWYPMQRGNLLEPNSAEVNLILGKNILEIDNGKTLGYLFVKLRQSAFSSIYIASEKADGSHFYLTDPTGEIVSASENSLLLQPLPGDDLRRSVLGASTDSFVLHSREGSELATKRSLNKEKWTLISITPLDKLRAGSRKISFIIMASIALFSLFAIIGAMWLSRLIALPIRKLTKLMEHVEEPKKLAPFQPYRKDEVGLLAAGYNEMKQQIKSLIERIHAEQQQKREYELALIQAQIKPHFLYNTLEVIYVLADRKQHREVKKATKALADYYRTALSGGREVITLGDELEMVRRYLMIQHLRYQEVFDYTIEMDEELADCPMLKLTVQPVIENAIYHGLKYKEARGKLAVEARLEDGHIRLVVQDDGAGMPLDRLQEVMSSERENGSSKSFGLYSIHHRLQLFYGRDYGLAIQSAPGAGTTVTIRIPYSKGC